MGVWMNPWLALLALCLAPLVLLLGIGLVLAILRIIVVVQKAAEPPTMDKDGHYSLDQGREVGRDT